MKLNAKDKSLTKIRKWGAVLKEAKWATASVKGGLAK